MKKARDIYDSYLRELREQHPQDEPVMRAAIDAFDSIQARKSATARLLAPIVEAASDSRRMISEIPVAFLDQLTEKHAEACEAVSRMAIDKRGHTRFNAIMCIGKAAPLAFKVKLLRQGLRDKSSKVRQMSADWTGRLRLRELVPDLEEAVAAEQDAKTKATMQYALNCLNGGYTVKHESDGTVAVTKFTLNGGQTRWFEKEELDRRGIEAILAEFDGTGLTNG
jgi:hypothetical protein